MVVGGCKASCPANDRYADARAFTPPSVDGLIRNEIVKPHWIGETERFWYRRDTGEGSAFILVDADAGTRVPAFDHDAAAIAMSAAMGQPIDPANLPVETLEFSADLATVCLLSGQAAWRLDPRTGNLEPLDVEAAPGAALASPDGRYSAFCRDHNIWLRDTADGSERALTGDGTEAFSYGKVADTHVLAFYVNSNRAIIPPLGCVWSPNSRWLIVPRHDERGVVPYPFISWAPPGKTRPTVTELRRPLLGDGADEAICQYFAIDVRCGSQHPLHIPKELNGFIGPGNCWWNEASTVLYTTAQDHAYRRATLLAIRLPGGDADVLIDERVATHHDYNLEPYRAPNVRILKDGAEIIWFSQRDGWGHLYLYDGVTGQVIRQLTQGDWAVFDVMRVDEARRIVYFAAGGKEAGRNPYYRHLYRVGLDSADAPVLLTPEDADHDFRTLPAPHMAFLAYFSLPGPPISPGARFFLDTFSAVSSPPVTKLRSTLDGAVVMTLEAADTSALDALGYQPPLCFVEKADDGVSDIHGLVYFPPDYDPARRYPVVDALMVAPHQRAVQHHFTGALWDWNPPGPLALSRLGFIVVQLEGRGSSHRDKAFHDFAYGHFARGGLIDHVCVIQRLARRYPSMDINRMGVYGCSLAAYFVMRALLDYPEFYKAGVALAGTYHFDGQTPSYIQKWQGPIQPGEGLPASYRELDCRLLASRLAGKLLMVTADLDDTAPIALTMQMADALTKAGKDFELLVMMGHGHLSLFTDPYVLRRMWDFFQRHLF